METVIVPVEEIDRAVLRIIDYAQSLSPDVTAVNVTDNLQKGEDLRSRWEEQLPDVPIVIVESPYRAFVACGAPAGFRFSSAAIGPAAAGRRYTPPARR